MKFLNLIDKQATVPDGGGDPFFNDVYRDRLAFQGEINRLKESYAIGVLPELPELSSEPLWNEMAGYEVIPDFRLRRLRQVANRLPKSGIVLDVGSGWGEIIPMVQEKPELRYVAMDFSEEMLNKLSDRYPKIRKIHGEIKNLDEKFSAIMALEVCEHIPATKVLNFYADLRRNLVEDGLLLITVPLYENLKEQTLKCPNCHHMHNRMGHVRSYTPRLIMEELKLGGFKVISIEYLYLNFNSNYAGTVKRVLLNLARKIAGLGQFHPLNAIIVAKPDS
jgi:SAM-dependent methyltransferase